MSYGHFFFIHNQICCNVRYPTLLAIVQVDYYHSVCDAMSSVRA